MSYCVLIPAYRPDAKLLDLCGALRARGLPVIVVDDGSGAAFAPVFSQVAALGAVLLRHEVNRGKGAALKTGIAYALSDLPGLCVVSADADGQHTPEDIARVAEAAEAAPASVVLGVREFSQMPARSRTGNTITRFFFRLATGLSISDTQTGLRGFPPDTLERLLKIEGERYEYEMNMLLELKRLGLACAEVPIATIYIDNNASSHFNALRDGARVFSRVLKYCAAALASTVVDYLLYILLLRAFSPALSFILARVASSVLNFELNRRAVFGARLTLKGVLGYAALALAVMLLGSRCVALLCAWGMHALLAKLLTDAVFFVINYNVQKYVIFK